MGDTFITIPGVSVHHVLGDATVTLGAGELNVLPASSGQQELMLTVGSAGFALHSNTLFGTVEGDPRVYVFSPEIEGVEGGFVKLILPEGVTEDGSRLSELQTKFEEVLIAHGLLQPGGEAQAAIALATDANKPLVAIPGVVATQVLGEEATVLSSGTLEVLVLPQSGKDQEPVLTLTVGKAAFPLYKSTAFGTLANDSRTYVFTPAIEGVNKGFVAIALPESEEDLSEQQNQLELILIEHGLLKDGFEAAADEVARSVREDSARTAERIRAARDFYLSTHPRTTDPAQFSSTTHGVAESGMSGTQSVARVARRMSGAVLTGAVSAGAWIASTFVPKEKETTERLLSASRGTEDLASGVGAGVGEVTDTAKDAAGSVLEHDYGVEAREVIGDVGQSVSNVGAAVGHVATATSGAPIAVAGLKGAASRQDEERQELEELEEELEEAGETA